MEESHLTLRANCIAISVGYLLAPFRERFYALNDFDDDSYHSGTPAVETREIRGNQAGLPQFLVSIRKAGDPHPKGSGTRALRPGGG